LGGRLNCPRFFRESGEKGTVTRKAVGNRRTRAGWSVLRGGAVLARSRRPRALQSALAGPNAIPFKFALFSIRCANFFWRNTDGILYRGASCLTPARRTPTRIKRWPEFEDINTNPTPSIARGKTLVGRRFGDSPRRRLEHAWSSIVK